MLARMLMSRADALSVAGLGTRTAPVAMAGSIAVLPAAIPVTPQLTSAVAPPGALFAEITLSYVGAAGSTSGVAAFQPFISTDGIAWAVPFQPYGYGLVEGLPAADGVTSIFVTNNIPLSGRSYVGIAAKEDGDGTHRGALSAVVVWLS